MASLEKNIFKNYLLRFFGFTFVYVPITVIYLQSKGLSLREILLLKAYFSIVIFFMEIPSGYLADWLGRRRILALAGLFLSAAMFAYVFSSGLFGFLIAETILGFGISLVSGADTALVYDTLLALKRSGDYLHLESRLVSCSSYAEAFGGLMAGGLAAIDLRAPFLVQGVFFLVFALIALSLVEPPHEITHEHEKHMLQIAKTAFGSFRESALLLWLGIFSAISGSATFLIVWYSQAYMKQIDIPVAWFGIAWMVFHLWLGFVASRAYDMERALGRKRCLLLINSLVVVGFVAMAFVDAMWGVTLVLAFYFVRGLRTPIMRTYINERIESSSRATVLSIVNFKMRLIFAVLSPFLGWVADLWTFDASLLAAAAIYLVMGFVAYRKLVVHSFILPRSTS